MKGTGPLGNTEIQLISACFDGNPFEAQQSQAFHARCEHKDRILELLSLQIADVYQNGSAVTDMLFDRSISLNHKNHSSDDLCTVDC